MDHLYFPSVVKDMNRELRAVLAVTFSTIAFKQICLEHEKIFTESLVEINPGNYEKEADFLRESAELRLAIRFWRELATLADQMSASSDENQEEN